MTTILSLFSGIGGLEYGLELAGLGPVVAQVEVDSYCREILARHWPNAQRVRYVQTVARDPTRVPDAAILCGGFPCQRLGLGPPACLQLDENRVPIGLR